MKTREDKIHPRGFSFAENKVFAFLPRINLFEDFWDFFEVFE